VPLATFGLCIGAEYRLFVTKLYTILGAGRTHFQSVNFITSAPTLRHPVESNRIESNRIESGVTPPETQIFALVFVLPRCDFRRVFTFTRPIRSTSTIRVKTCVCQVFCNLYSAWFYRAFPQEPANVTKALGNWNPVSIWHFWVHAFATLKWQQNESRL